MCVYVNFVRMNRKSTFTKYLKRFHMTYFIEEEEEEKQLKHREQQPTYRLCAQLFKTRK